MPGFSISAPLSAPPDKAWADLRDHPELLWGHNAPDLLPGTAYAALTQHGIGGTGRIEQVEGRRVAFTWAGVGWPEPGRFTLRLDDDATLTADGVPSHDHVASAEHWQLMLDSLAAFVASSNPSPSPVAAVLFDADGVLQWPRDGWLDELTRLGGPTFVADAFAAELDCLAGGADLADKLRPLLAAAGTGGTVERVLAAWHDIAVDADALALVDRIRAGGIRVGLATNQQSYRGAHMRDRLGMDEHFDDIFYSYEVGLAKPSAEYFEHVLERLAVPAERVVFVDDAPANVVAAREAGIRAALHRVKHGATGLARELAELGVPC